MITFKFIPQELGEKHLGSWYKTVEDCFDHPEKLGVDPQIVLEGLIKHLARYSNGFKIRNRMMVYIDRKGYVNIWVGRKSHYVHRLVAEWRDGCDAVEGMDVHHINCDRQDNRPDNLQVLPHEEHMAIHAQMERLFKDFYHAANILDTPELIQWAYRQYDDFEYLHDFQDMEEMEWDAFYMGSLCRQSFGYC